MSDQSIIASGWKHSLSDYDVLRALQFDSRDTFRSGTEIIFHMPDLKGAPFRSGGLYCLVVPEEAAQIAGPKLRESGINFTEKTVQRVNRLPAEKAPYIRKKAGFFCG